MNNNRGFTLLETSVTSAIFAVLLGTATGALMVDTSAHKVLTAEMGPVGTANIALRRITAELRMAGLTAEDANGNGVLDEGEDINENGELDADWNLDDGAKDQPTLIFNRRVEIRYSRDDVAPSTVYSRKIVYSVENKRLVRTAVSTDFVGEKTIKRKFVVAREVDAVRFSRSGRLITVELDVIQPGKMFKRDKHTITEKIFLRN